MSAQVTPTPAAQINHLSTPPVPMYYLIPVNQFGEKIPDIGPLERTGIISYTLVALINQK